MGQGSDLCRIYVENSIGINPRWVHFTTDPFPQGIQHLEMLPILEMLRYQSVISDILTKEL